jgi:hypothetical protein
MKQLKCKMTPSYKVQPEIDKGQFITWTAPAELPTFESNVESIKDTSSGESPNRAADEPYDVQF